LELSITEVGSMRYWIKLYTEIVRDPKMGRLSDRQFRLCINLFAIAGEHDRDGALPPVSDIAWLLRDDEEEIAQDLEALAKVNIVERVDDIWIVRKWAERQAKAPSASRESVRTRVTDYRKQKRNEGVTTLHDERNEGVTTLKRDGNEDVTSTREEKSREDTDTEQKRIDQKAAAPHPRLPPAAKIYLDNGGKFPTGKMTDGTLKQDRAIQFIAEHIRDDPTSLELWGRVVAGYCAQWSAKSYTVMINDYYAIGRIPGQPNPQFLGASRSNGHGAAQHNRPATAEDMAPRKRPAHDPVT
jgi:hypothetical protein